MGAIRKMKPDYVIKAVVMIVIGIVLAVWTKASLDIMARTLASLLFLIGAVFVITYLVKKERTFMISGGLVAGILIAAVGGWIFANPGKFTDFIPKLFGIFIMVSGLGNLWQAFSLVKYKSRTWWVSLLIAIVTALLGAFLFFNPTGAKEIAVTVIGAFLIVDGATNLISALLVGIASNKAEQERAFVESRAESETEIVEAEVVDGKVVEVEDKK